MNERILILTTASTSYFCYILIEDEKQGEIKVPLINISLIKTIGDDQDA